MEQVTEPVNNLRSHMQTHFNKHPSNFTLNILAMRKFAAPLTHRMIFIFHKSRLFHNFIFYVPKVLAVFINHVIKFKSQPGHLKDGLQQVSNLKNSPTDAIFHSPNPIFKCYVAHWAAGSHSQKIKLNHKQTTFSVFACPVEP